MGAVAARRRRAAEAAKRDATLLALKLQEDAGIDIVTDGEQSRQHFVHGFLEAIEGIDFARSVEMGIRNDRYKAMVPDRHRPAAAARRACMRGRRGSRAPIPRRKLKFTLPGPMTIVDTIADAHYGDRVAMAMAFAELLNEEAREAGGRRRRCHPVRRAGLQRLSGRGRRLGHRGAAPRHRGPRRKTAVHICYGYGIQANIEWKATLGGEWRQYEQFFPALAASRIDQVSLECANSRVPMSLLGLLDGKDVLVGAIDVATDAGRDAGGGRRRHRAR